MSLEFAPLAWIYHDGWRFADSKTLIKYGNDGQPVFVDASKTSHQRGHVHLFLPSVPFSLNGSSLAYWGEQSYSFSVKDEWGPNSNDPSQNDSVRLIGKPIWYFHIEEYWRRFYIQPWDIVDPTCNLPLNQAIEYDKRDLEDYCHSLISPAPLPNNYYYEEDYEPPLVDRHYSYNGSGTRITFTDAELDERIRYGGYGDDAIGYIDFLRIKRRAAARRLYIRQDKLKEPVEAWISTNFPIHLGYTIDNLPDDVIVEYLSQNIVVTETINGNPVATAIRYMDDFEVFFARNAQFYDGYVDTLEVLQEFMRLNNITMKAGSKLGEDSTVFIPRDKTIGHVGIKFDASKPCHSLGPFREGGEFYFFNTVVNRSMPCEYWLDADKRSRQYFIKQPSLGWEDTSGGQVWTFSGDRSRFIWVCDMFSETRELLGDDYNVDAGLGSYIGTRRYPNLLSSYNHTCFGMNAKRLKDDLSIDIGTGTPHSDNNRVPQSLYNTTITPDDVQDDVETLDEPKKVVYSETGWTIDQSGNQDSSSPPPVPNNTYQWENDGWTGWYEKNELVKCVVDERWYKRTWSPTRYSPTARFTGAHPYWTVEKRQNFPNPSPFLCNRPDGLEYSSSSSGELPEENVPTANWCTSRPYDNDEANRNHLLHWQYALYFNLARTYPREGVADQRTLRRHFFMYSSGNGVTFTSVQCNDPDNPDIDARYISPHEQEDANYSALDYIDHVPADWETAMEEWMESEDNQNPTIDDEDAIFDDWISRLGQAFFFPYEDKESYWVGEAHEETEILPTQIRAGGKYATTDGEGNEILLPLPQPQYRVSYHSRGDDYGLYHFQTFLSFAEFSSVWTALTDEETSRLSLEGDMPKRNDTPYDNTNIDLIYPDLESLNGPEQAFKQDTLDEISEGLHKEASPSLLVSKFFPRIDHHIRAHNLGKSAGEPTYTVSPLDELGDENTPGTLAYITTNGLPIDPYRNGEVNPIHTWKTHFNHRELFTLPEETVAKGNSPLPSLNPDGTPNSPLVHPRECSYHHEDGARRHYPDDMFVSPVLEYQKITYDGRLPGKEREEAFIQTNWKTTKNPQWGDGFNVNISIPMRKQGEVQSPFSDGNNITKPIGEYAHNVVKPENMLRYHLEFYDSLDQIRKYDFPNYINIIHAFQKRHMPTTPLPPTQTTDPNTGETYMVDNTDFTQSYYKEDFNDYEKTKAYRTQSTNLAGLPQAFSTWQEALDDYWLEINGNKETPKQNIFINQPVARNINCHGEEVQENTFERLDDGTLIWREQTTCLLPTIDKIDYLDDGRPGYLDSHGNYIKGGGKVVFNNPYQHNTDGKWYEECLGATVKAECHLILEDALGYRWIQVVNATALQPTQPIRGTDFVD